MRPLKDVYTFYDPKSKIWSGPPLDPLLNPYQNLAQLVLSLLDRDRNRVVQINADENGSELTAAQLRLEIVRVAQHLSKRGFRDGDFCVMATGNGDHTAAVLFACLALGIPVNTLDPSFGRDELGHMLDTVRPRLIFCDEGQTLEEMEAACRTVDFGSTIFVMGGERTERCEHVMDLLEPTGVEDIFRPVHLSDASQKLAILICSSGTTGRSKAVSLSHATCITNVANFFNCHHDDRIFAFSSLYWLSGLMILLIGTLWGATRIITKRRFSSGLLLELIERYQLSMISIPPSQAFALVQDPSRESTDLSSLRLVIIGGGPVSAHLKRSFQQLVPRGAVEVAYGLSELGGSCTVSSEEFYRNDSVGFPRAGMELMIIDEDGTPLNPGQQGEILVRARDVFMGYFKNHEATKNMIDSNGWLHTGDVGWFDQDGFLYFVERIKDIIKFKNFPFGPTEIENIILQVQGVKAACVVGIPTDSGSDLVTAMVVRDENSPLDMEQIILQAIRQKLPDYKQLRGGVFFGKELPMTPSGKILRREVRKFINERLCSQRLMEI